MNWTVDLTVSFIPCPPEHAPAWRRAMEALREMAMHTGNTSKTADGRANYRPLATLNENDYPPESGYWMNATHLAAVRLSERMGYLEYCEWIDAQGEPAHWRALYDLIREKEIELTSEVQISTMEGAMG